MTFQSEGSDENANKKKSSIPENDEVNPEAYEPANDGSERSEKKEQAGVVHLVHGWPQQGQARSKVCLTLSLLGGKFKTFSYLGTFYLWRHVPHKYKLGRSRFVLLSDQVNCGGPCKDVSGRLSRGIREVQKGF